MSFIVYKKLQYYLKIHKLTGQYPIHPLDMHLARQQSELLTYISKRNFYLEMKEARWSQDLSKILLLADSKRVAQNQEHQMGQVLLRNKHYLCLSLGNLVLRQLWLRTHQLGFYNFLSKEWEETSKGSQLIFLVWAGKQAVVLQVKWVV